MLSKKEIQQAISESEKNMESLQDCERLATFYTIYDHLYGPAVGVEKIQEETVPEIGDSDFLKKIQGKKSEDAWKLMDELIQAVQVLNPKLYQETMKRI